MKAEKTLPALVLREMVLLPGNIINFDINKPQALSRLEEVMSTDQLIFVITQIEGSDPASLDGRFYSVGLIAKIRQISKMPNSHMQLMLEGVKRAKLLSAINGPEGELTVTVEEIDDNEDKLDRVTRESMLRIMRETFIQYEVAYPNKGRTIHKEIHETDSLSALIDLIVANIPLPYEVKQGILELIDVEARFERVISILTTEVEVAKSKKAIENRIKEKVNKSQKDYMLKEQMNAIKRELGEDEDSEIDEYRAAVDKLEASEEVKKKILKSIKHLESLNSSASETSVERGYIETLLELPWDKLTEDNNDIDHAFEILENDHYGLDKIKERIIEFLAVRALTDKGDSPIICLVGPPGTGKTSIARSIATALNKKYARICLGGVKDESEIRGHRKTYVAAMPGRLVAALKSAGVKNPLILLDEIDKVSTDPMKDTSAALLEVLDSEQNSAFRDHYVEIPIDLSEVLFVATANNVSTIPKPLLDRMEIIEVSSYTANEKFHIAKEHLLKKQYKKNGLKSRQISINDGALKKIIEGYTREAGVRELERTIAKICRKAAKIILEEGADKVSVNTRNLEDFLGKAKYRKDTKNEKDEVGIVRGLAWTSVGGDTLSIEVNTYPGKGNLELTGQLGDVMKESAHAGLSYIRSVGKEYGIEPKFFEENDIHIHIPEGAVPKDGPSAGITMATAMLSAITNIPVSRNIAMTGEITLRGRVLPIGGLKEKLLAAKTAGIYKVLVPDANQKDVEEISEEILDEMEIVFVKEMKEVLLHALCR